MRAYQPYFTVRYTLFENFLENVTKRAHTLFLSRIKSVGHSR